MADIARIADVSKATVSRALNHSTRVNQETRKCILELASSLKYRLTIRQPVHAAGVALVDAWLALVEGGPAASSQFPTELIVRATAA